MYRRLAGVVFSSLLAGCGFCSKADFFVQNEDAYLTTQWESSSVDPPHPLHIPHIPGHHPPEKINGTILTALSTDPGFSRLYKVVNISDDIVALLNDSSVNLTFFALPNSALPKPRHPPHDPPDIWSLELLQKGVSLVDLISIVESTEENGFTRPSDEQIKKFVTAILAYHIIPDSLALPRLIQNTTYPTKLAHVFGALNDESLRVRVGAALPFARVNFYSEIIKPDIATTNGFIHAINRPLFPPLSVFQTTFLLQHTFSTYSSAIQRTSITNSVDYRYVPESLNGVEGSPVVTAFIPSNKAFWTLPKNLQLFLFSPIGERALKKLLDFHIIPDVALYTDWVLNTTSDSIIGGAGANVEPPHRFPGPPRPKPDIVGNYTLPTALEDHSLNVLVAKFPIKLPLPGKGKTIGYIKRLIVNGQQTVEYDGVALNGAFHVVDRLINPRHGKGGPPGHGHEEDDSEVSGWQDWAEWLPAWAEN